MFFPLDKVILILNNKGAQERATQKGWKELRKMRRLDGYELNEMIQRHMAQFKKSEVLPAFESEEADRKSVV